METKHFYISADEALEAMRNGGKLRFELGDNTWCPDCYIDDAEGNEVGKIYRYTYLYHFQGIQYE